MTATTTAPTDEYTITPADVLGRWVLDEPTPHEQAIFERAAGTGGTILIGPADPVLVMMAIAAAEVLCNDTFVLVATDDPARFLRLASIAIERFRMLKSVDLNAQCIELGRPETGWKSKGRIDVVRPNENLAPLYRNRYDLLLVDVLVDLTGGFRNRFYALRSHHARVFELAASEPAAPKRHTPRLALRLPS